MDQFFTKIHQHILPGAKAETRWHCESITHRSRGPFYPFKKFGSIFHFMPTRIKVSYKRLFIPFMTAACVPPLLPNRYLLGKQSRKNTITRAALRAAGLRRHRPYQPPSGKAAISSQDSGEMTPLVLRAEAGFLRTIVFRPDSGTDGGTDGQMGSFHRLIVKVCPPTLLHELLHHTVGWPIRDIRGIFPDRVCS